MSRQRSRLAALALISVTLFGATLAPAAPNNNNLDDDIRRQDKQIAEAKHKLAAARQEATKAREAAAREQIELKKATDAAGDMRRKVEQEHDSAPALVAAREQLAKHKARFEELRAAVFTQLAQDAAYQQAVAARDELKGKLSGTTGSDSRDALAKQYAQLSADVRRLEQEAIAADKQASAAQTAVLQTETKIRALVETREAAIDKDSRLHAVRSELEKAKQQFAAAEKKLATELKQFNDAERKVQQEEQQKRNLEQKKRQQQQQKNKNKNKKKK